MIDSVITKLIILLGGYFVMCGLHWVYDLKRIKKEMERKNKNEI